MVGKPLIKRVRKMGNSFIKIKSGETFTPLEPGEQIVDQKPSASMTDFLLCPEPLADINWRGEIVMESNGSCNGIGSYKYSECPF